MLEGRDRRGSLSVVLPTSPKRHSLLSVCCLLVVPACREEKPPGAPPENIEVRDDASPIGRAVPKEDAGPPIKLPTETARIPKLQGTWRGEANTRDFGHVKARLVVDRLGLVHSEVSGPALARTDTFKIVHWDGQTLRVAGDEGEVTVKARRRGDELYVTLPQVGDVVLRRNKAEPLP